MQIVVNGLSEVGLAEECLHHIQTLVDACHIHKWKYCPALKHACSHCRNCAVDNIKQRYAIVLHRLQ